MQAMVYGYERNEIHRLKSVWGFQRQDHHQLFINSLSLVVFVEESDMPYISSINLVS
jgi:hypothetical protein